MRLQRFSYDAAGILTLGPQYAYAVDPIHIGTSTDSRTRSGVVDLVALPDSSLLVLERSLGISGVVFGVPLYQYEDRIYRVTFAGATDISQSPLNSGLIGQSYTPVSKTLLWKGQVGGGLGQNMEGLALGPQLPGGDWSLLGVVDNSGGSDPLSAANTLAAFSLAPSIAGDFNGDGLVDSADYVVWAKEPGHNLHAVRLRPLPCPLRPNRGQWHRCHCECRRARAFDSSDADPGGRRESSATPICIESPIAPRSSGRLSAAFSFIVDRSSDWVNYSVHEETI